MLVPFQFDPRSQSGASSGLYVVAETDAERLVVERAMKAVSRGALGRIPGELPLIIQGLLLTDPHHVSQLRRLGNGEGALYIPPGTFRRLTIA
jgi:hypothetical protein